MYNIFTHYITLGLIVMDIGYLISSASEINSILKSSKKLDISTTGNKFLPQTLFFILISLQPNDVDNYEFC